MTTTQMTKGNAEQKTRGESRGEGKAAQIETKTNQVIEKTAKAIPSGTFLVLAGGAIAGSLALKLMRRDSTANFVGQWAPTFLMLGLYTKMTRMVKMLGGQGQAATQERSGAMAERPGASPGASPGGSSDASSGASPGGSSGGSSGASSERPAGSQERPGFSH